MRYGGDGEERVIDIFERYALPPLICSMMMLSALQADVGYAMSVLWRYYVDAATFTPTSSMFIITLPPLRYY